MAEPPTASAPRHLPEAMAVPLPFLVLLVAAALAMAILVRPVKTPLFLAAVMAVVLQPPFVALRRWLGGRPRMAGALVTVLLLAGILLPALALTRASLHELTDGAAWLSRQFQVEGERPLSHRELAARAVSKLAEKLHLDADHVQSHLTDLTEAVQRGAPQMLGASLEVFGALVLFVIAFFFLLVDGHYLARFVGRISPLQDAQTNELLAEFRNVAVGALVGNVINGIAQGVIIFLGFFAAGIPHAAFFGILTVFTSLVPLVGSQLVYVPATVALCLQDRIVGGVALAVWCTVMVLFVDNFVKPRILRGKVEFHAGLLLLGFIGGLGCFGLPGLIAGPLVMAFALTLFRIYQRDYLNRGVVAGQRTWGVGV